MKKQIRYQKIYADINSKGSKVLIGHCSICNRNKSMTVKGNAIQAEGREYFSKKFRKKFC